jgi:hypothetical protein
MVLNRSNVVTSGDIYRDTTLEIALVPVTDPQQISLWSVHQRAQDIYKVTDGTTSYVRDSWTFDVETQTITLNEGLEFVSPTVTVTFNPGRPPTTTYLRNQPVLDGVTQLNEGTPPVPRGQTVEASKAMQVRDFPLLLPDRVTVPGYSPNDPKGIPDSTAFAAADTNTLAEFTTTPEALYQKMEFIEVTDEGEVGLIACLNDYDTRLPEGEVVGEDANGPAGPHVLAIEGQKFSDQFAFPMLPPFEQHAGQPGQFLVLGGGGYIGPVVDGSGDVTGLATLGGILGPETTIFHPLHPATRQITWQVDMLYEEAYEIEDDELLEIEVGVTGPLAATPSGDAIMAVTGASIGTLAGSLFGSAEMTGTLVYLIGMGVNLTGQAIVAGEVVPSLEGAISGQALVTGSVGGTVGPLAGVIDGRSIAVGDGSIVLPIAGAISGDAVTTGEIGGTPGPLAGVISGDAAVVGNGVVVGPLAGIISGDAVTVGNGVLIGSLAGSLNGQAIVLGDIGDDVPAAYGTFTTTVALNSTPPVGGVPVKAGLSAGTTVVGPVLNVTMPLVNRLMYTGGPTRFFKVTCNCTVISQPPGTSNGAIHLYKNGLAVPQVFNFANSTAGGSNGEATGFTTIVPLATGEYLEIWVSNTVGGTAMTLVPALLTIVALT